MRGLNCDGVAQIVPFSFPIFRQQIIKVTFPVFDIETSTDCANDYLQIHDGSSASAHQIGEIFSFMNCECLVVFMFLFMI